MKKVWIKWICLDYSVDYDAIAVDDIIDIHRYFMKKHDIKQCLNSLKKCLLQQLELLD